MNPEIHEQAKIWCSKWNLNSYSSLIIVSEMFWKHGWVLDLWDRYYLDTGTFITRKVEAFYIDQRKRTQKKMAYKNETEWLMGVCFAARHVCLAPRAPRNQHWKEEESMKEIDEWERWAIKSSVYCPLELELQ
jgi:hypothetical protein